MQVGTARKQLPIQHGITLATLHPVVYHCVTLATMWTMAIGAQRPRSKEVGPLASMGRQWLMQMPPTAMLELAHLEQVLCGNSQKTEPQQ